MIDRPGIPLDASLRSYDALAVSDATGTDTGPETLVQQSFAEDADINVIVRRFGLTRDMPAGLAGGVFGDFSGITDYESAVDVVRRAQEGFMALPADVRERFRNDPGALIRLAHELPEEEFVGMLSPAEAPAAPEPVPAAPAVP